MKEIKEIKERLNLGKQIVVFIGPEGSGKTVQAKRLAEESKKPYITTGNIIRDLAANDEGPLGEECREMFADHTYLRGETLLKILVERFSKSDAKEGLVLDGGLRTMEETKDFRKMLTMAGRDFDLTVIELQIPEDISFDRLLSGRKREDDTAEGIEKRLEKYYFKLRDRIKIIKSQKKWRHMAVDASPDPEAVYRAILQVL